MSSLDKSSVHAQSQLSSLSTVSAANHSTSVSIKDSLDNAIPRTSQALTEISDTLSTLKASLPAIKQDLTSISKSASRYETKSDLLNSAMVTLASTVANASPSSELLDKFIRAADVLSDLAERKKIDVPYILGVVSRRYHDPRLAFVDQLGPLLGSGATPTLSSNYDSCTTRRFPSPLS